MDEALDVDTVQEYDLQENQFKFGVYAFAEGFLDKGDGTWTEYKESFDLKELFIFQGL